CKSLQTAKFNAANRNRFGDFRSYGGADRFPNLSSDSGRKIGMAYGSYAFFICFSISPSFIYERWDILGTKGGSKITFRDDIVVHRIRSGFDYIILVRDNEH